MRTVAATVFVLVCGCASPVGAQDASSSDLEAELLLVREEISAAQAEDSALAGGLVKTLIQLRLAVLNNTAAMLDQKRLALAQGVAVTYTMAGEVFEPAEPTPEELGELEAAIQEAAADVAAAREEDARYSGGLVKAMAATRVATAENTLAMLRQRWYVNKYRIPYVLPGNLPTPDPTAQPTPSAESTGTPPINETSLRAQDGPFGTSMAMAREAVQAAAGNELVPVEGETFLFKSASAPRTHSDFEAYIYLITPKAGLCQLRVVGVDVASSSHGTEIRASFNDIVEGISSVYGDHRVSDYLKSGSIWNDPQDFMMGLRQKERVLQAAWDVEEGSTMQADVKQILLTASALDRSTAYVMLQYTFENHEACNKEVKAAERIWFP